MISVIVPVLNEASILLSSLTRLRELGPAHELIVVDGGSDDGTREIAAAMARLVLAPKGRAVQMNQGAEIATGEALLFLHADVWIEDGALAAIEQAVALGMVGGTFRQGIEGEQSVFRWIERAANFRARRLGLYYGDAGIFVTRAAFDAIGGFPEVAIGEEFGF